MSAATGTRWRRARRRAGRKPDRRDWRLVREVFVADTDEEAWKLSTGDMMGRMMSEYFLPLLGHFGFKDYLKHCARGARQRRHRGLLRDVTTGSSARPTPSPRRSSRSGTRSAASACCSCSASTTSTSRKPGSHSLQLLKHEVLPRLKHLDTALGKAA